MNNNTTNTSDLSENIRAFLLNANWVLSKQVRGLSFFTPPESLGILGKYSIAIPDDPSRPGVTGLIHDAADTLVKIYGYSKIGDLLNRASLIESIDQSTKIVARFLDKMTQDGAIPLSALAAYINHMETSLYRSAKFRLGTSDDSVLIAKQFAKDCRFLQTAVGSFIAKVEIPSTILRQADLFGEKSVVESTEITSSLFSALEFLNNEILNDNQPFDDSDIITNALSLFDLDLLTSLTDVLLGSEMQSIEFSFEFGKKVRMTSTGWITPEKRNRLKEFVSFVRNQLRN